MTLLVCEGAEPAGKNIVLKRAGYCQNCVYSVAFCAQSVVQVLDPQLYLTNVKKDLSEKQGLPAEHQRLTFTVATAVEKAVVAPPLPASVESLLSELHTWQVSVG